MFGGKIGLPELFVILIIGVLPAVLGGQIFHKAGYSRWLGLLIMLPLVNLLTILWFALSKWPVETEVEWLRMKLAQATPGYTKPQGAGQ